MASGVRASPWLVSTILILPAQAERVTTLKIDAQRSPRVSSLRLLAQARSEAPSRKCVLPTLAVRWQSPFSHPLSRELSHFEPLYDLPWWEPQVGVLNLVTVLSKTRPVQTVPHPFACNQHCLWPFSCVLTSKESQGL